SELAKCQPFPRGVQCRPASRVSCRARWAHPRDDSPGMTRGRGAVLTRTVSPIYPVIPAKTGIGGGFPRPVEEGIRRVQHLFGKRELPLDSLPMLVWFRDVNDPKTVEQVHPHDLAERFGTSVKLIGATLEIVPAGSQLFWDTGEPITTGALERSAW